MHASINITLLIDGVDLRYLSPSFRSSKPLAILSLGMNGGSFMSNNETITAMKLTPFERKQTLAPNFSNTIPDNAGPINRAPFTIDEFKAIALGRYSLWSIMSYTNACRAGTSNALIQPRHDAQRQDVPYLVMDRCRQSR
ncbi:MAG: hypothetical protein WDO15_09290 [Bacteroidota bacterium]